MTRIATMIMAVVIEWAEAHECSYSQPSMPYAKEGRYHGLLSLYSLAQSHQEFDGSATIDVFNDYVAVRTSAHFYGRKSANSSGCGHTEMVIEYADPRCFELLAHVLGVWLNSEHHIDASRHKQQMITETVTIAGETTHHIKHPKGNWWE